MYNKSKKEGYEVELNYKPGAIKKVYRSQSMSAILKSCDRDIERLQKKCKC